MTFRVDITNDGEAADLNAFFIRGLTGNDLTHVVNIVAPNYLMGFARATVADLVVQGGFPPFLLPLVTFEGLHALATALTDMQAGEELHQARLALFRRVPVRTG